MPDNKGKESDIDERLIAPDGIIVLNKDMNIIVFNQAACRITGYAERDVLGRNIHALLTGSEEETSFIEQSLSLGEVSTNISLTFRRNDNSKLQVMASLTPLTRSEQKIIGLIIVFRDIRETMNMYTELQKKNREIAAEKSKLEAIFRSRIEGTFTVDMKGVITSFNNSAERITAYPQKEVTGKVYWNVFMPGDSEESDYFNSVIYDSDFVQQRELLFTSKKNIRIPVRCNAGPLLDEKGKKIGAVLSFQDISELKNLSTHLEERFQFNNIIGRSRAMNGVYNLMESVINTDSTVLITGASGTGKEVVARAIHLNSDRRTKPFVPVNCTAFVETLLESELFGHEKGAFTGAVKSKPGRFELAGDGTIFLDEIGEVSLPVQVKLLRVLENRQYERVGGTQSLELKARIITATHRNLEEDIKTGRFREDLFYRINVINIHLPTLSERKDDIPGLVDHFINKFNNKFRKDIKGISSGALRLINHYTWPGNIRELENVIEHAFVVCRGDIIDTEHLPERLWSGLGSKDTYTKNDMQTSPLDNAEKKMIEEMLNKFNGSRIKTAKALGINKTTLWRKMKKYGLM